MSENFLQNPLFLLQKIFRRPHFSSEDLKEEKSLLLKKIGAMPEVIFRAKLEG